MPVKFIIEDENDNELGIYVNNDNEIYLHIGDIADDFINRGYIFFTKDDAKALVKEMNKLIKEI
jgi:polyhydroxyalkanoate synthesis regulator phasin